MKNFTFYLFFLFVGVVGVMAQPANDFCAGAIPITPSIEGTGCSAATFFLPFISDGTTDSGILTVCSNSGKDQWFTWTATSVGLRFFSKSPGQPGIAIYADCVDASNGVDIACLNTFESGDLIGWGIGDNLLIQIYDFEGSSADVGFCLEEHTPPVIPTNDACVDAILAVDGQLHTGNTTLSTNIEALAGCSGGGGSCAVGGTGLTDFTEGVWFFYTSVGGEIITASTANVGTDFDTELQVFEGACGTLNCIGGDDDGGDETGHNADSEFCFLSTATTYYFYIDGNNGATGNYAFTLDAVPYCGSNAIGLPTGASTTTSGGSCEDGPWTYYNNGTSDSYIFAIQWDPNSIGGGYNAVAKAAAIASVQVDATPNSPNVPASGTFFMGRQWEVDLGGATLDGPVNIKYFYDPAEKSNAAALASNHASANGTTDYGFLWFKMDGNFDFSMETDPAFQPDTYLTETTTGTENGITFSQFDGIASFSSGSGAARADAGTLPVEFTSFTAKADGKVNLLNWTTASEENSSHYEVERSAHGQHFENIGHVNAAGISTEVLDYDFTDEKPLAAAYYRLKQIDLDGQYDYSKTLNIARSNTGISIGNVRPNPTKNATTIQFNNNVAGKVSISLTDVNGKVVFSQPFDSVSGINQKELDLSGFANGVYFLSINNNDGKAATRIIKAK